MELVVFVDRNVFSEQVLNPNKVTRFGVVTEGVRHTLTTGTRRASNAMHVHFGFVRKIVVEHVRDVFDVDATAGDVGRHKHVHSTLLEIAQRLRPSGLRLVSVDGLRIDVRLLKLTGKTVGAMLGSCEDNRAANAFFMNELNEHAALVGLFDEEHLLLDAICGHFLRTHVHRQRIVQHVGHNVVDRIGHGGAEQQVLPLVRHHANDALDVVNEAHVEHAVGLVEDEVLDIAEVDVALFFQVKQTAWRGHENVDPTAEGIDLRTLSNPAEDDFVAQTEGSTVDLEPVSDLCGQFPRGREDEGSNRTPPLDLLR
jgi:hypothetical protein